MAEQRKPDEMAIRCSLSDAELLDALTFGGSETLHRLSRRYSWPDATPQLTRAAIALELPLTAIRRAKEHAHV